MLKFDSTKSLSKPESYMYILKHTHYFWKLNYVYSAQIILYLHDNKTIRFKDINFVSNTVDRQ